MSAPGAAKVPQTSGTNDSEDKGNAISRRPRNSRWQVWKQVLIAELLNVLEGRRYDNPAVK